MLTVDTTVPWFVGPLGIEPRSRGVKTRPLPIELWTLLLLACRLLRRRELAFDAAEQSPRDVPGREGPVGRGIRRRRRRREIVRRIDADGDELTQAAQPN